MLILSQASRVRCNRDMSTRSAYVDRGPRPWLPSSLSDMAPGSMLTMSPTRHIALEPSRHIPSESQYSRPWSLYLCKALQCCAQHSFVRPLSLSQCLSLSISQPLHVLLFLFLRPLRRKRALDGCLEVKRGFLDQLPAKWPHKALFRGQRLLFKGKHLTQ